MLRFRGDEEDTVKILCSKISRNSVRMEETSKIPLREACLGPRPGRGMQCLGGCPGRGATRLGMHPGRDVSQGDSGWDFSLGLCSFRHQFVILQP